ncbi:hypothetical protein CRE_28172 [Caenorhabditis remanei]|uniref:Uncharacterized protein n=1 Tax=Caenorhabditis remanei TaxID=31234 RepID=E3LMQ2_CAERE|nr:hypothetical protein CRE_28172 [Caenorhabditis remanei]
MGVYDDVSTFCDYSPTSTVSTSSSSSSSGLASPVYENVEELTGLCSRSWKMMGKRTSKPSMSDFLAQLPPPPPAFDDEVYGGGGFGKRPVESSTSTASSSASSRRPIISSSSSSNHHHHHPPIPSSSSSSPPVLLSSPPHPPVVSSSNCSSNPHPMPQISRCFDMRPLSLPHKEMQRIEREQSHRVLVITLLIITIFIVMIALGIYVFYDVIAEHINNIAGTF